MNASHLRTLKKQLNDERDLPEAQRATGAADASLDGVLKDLGHVIELLQADKIEAAAVVVKRVAYHVAESWSHKAPLSLGVLEQARAVQRLAERTG